MNISLKTTVEDLWQKYSKKVYQNVNLIPQTYRERKQDFFSGCFAMLTTYHVNAVTHREDPAKVLAWIESVKAEMDQYFEESISRILREEREKRNAKQQKRSS